MAQVHGFLREDKATHGEKVVLDQLEQNLPKEYAVYVECPLQDRRALRYPDFIVATNYGVIVLEVKDWVEVIKADKYYAQIRTRTNKFRREGNPVEKAREYAILLHNELKRIALKGQTVNVPWGYAVVLPNLPTSVITQLRSVWGQEFVFNTHDLQAYIVTNRLKNTLPVKVIRSLTKQELDLIRATINPVVLIEQPERSVILDEQQERIVTESVKEPAQKPVQETPEPVQIGFLDDSESIEAEQARLELPDYQLDISQNTAIRLVRGIAGSGKSLVLAQRARYLAAQYPEWNILVLTYNKELRKNLEARLKGIPGIKVRHFHNMCSQLMRGYQEWKPEEADGWLESFKNFYPIIQQMGVNYISDEIEWIKDARITSLKDYLEVRRKGRGRQLASKQREQLFEVYQAYQAYLEQQGYYDWADIPQILVDGISSGAIQPPEYDAILIDEAQDFAPGWIRLVAKMFTQDGGILFLTDDPTQSIYRLYSWREKGVHVVGRTRWLRVPYRNTYEIYQAAYQLIASDEKLLAALQDEGILVVPDLHDQRMRHGTKPLLQKFNDFDEEIEFIKNKVHYLLQSGVDSQQIAVLHRRTSGVMRLKGALRGVDVQVNTFHAYKGMEFEVVFLTQLQETSINQSLDEAHQKERRLVYMAMTRAREQLFMGYSGRLPGKYLSLKGFVDHVV